MKKLLLWVLILLSVLPLAGCAKTAPEPVTQPLPEGVLTVRRWGMFEAGSSGQEIRLEIPEAWGNRISAIFTSHVPDTVVPEHNGFYESRSLLSDFYVGSVTKRGIYGYSRVDGQNIGRWAVDVHWDPGVLGYYQDRRDSDLPWGEWFQREKELFLTIQIQDNGQIIGYAVLQQFYVDFESQRTNEAGEVVATNVIAQDHYAEVLEAVYFPEVNGQRQNITQEYVDGRFAAIMEQACQKIAQEKQ
jgi:hypothetical protein